ncbi:MAG: bifunctional phosphoglucose/phosphomannose isomerase [Actinomycetota bacterium]
MERWRYSVNGMFIDLDEVEKVKAVDAEGMLLGLEHFPDQCEEAVRLAEETPLDFRVPSINSILIMGMGGSGISGDIIKTILSDEVKVPIWVSKGYSIPNFVDQGTLCFAVSYSGDTEETLSCFDKAVRLGCPIISIASGGMLESVAQRHGMPVIKIPGGIQPRSALGYLTLPILIALQKFDIIANKAEDIKETIKLLKSKAKKLSLSRSSEQNGAKGLAIKLFGRIPVVYGSDGPTAVAALRWKCQFNENAKIPAFWHVFPELNHNETVGWELLQEITENFHLILLRDEGEPERIKRRIEITRSLIEDHFGDVVEVWTEGKSKLARTFSIIYFGDFVGVYLAVLNGVDPTPVHRITLLKRKLAESS